MAKVAMIFVLCLSAVTYSAMAATLVENGRERVKKERMQDGIVLDVHGEEASGEGEEMRFEVNPESLVELGSGSYGQLEAGKICKDVEPEHTGFDVHDDNGFMKHASCEDLAPAHCHNSTMGEQIRESCPVSCFICLPPGGIGDTTTPCFDAQATGIKFRYGPKATCKDLINYCNHTMIGHQVSQACRLTCGQCDLHVEGPFVDAYGNCVDLGSHEEPQFTVAGKVAGCADVSAFCKKHPDSYLIRHKCPLTCGICSNDAASTSAAPVTTEAPEQGDVGGCDRRRRWGFCSTRRRRNV